MLSFRLAPTEFPQCIRQHTHGAAVVFVVLKNAVPYVDVARFDPLMEPLH